jgi:tetratricopeptide (TPR) repeat protein
MPRGFLLLLCCTVALGQVEPRDPFDRAMQSSQQARTQGNPVEAATRREEARKLLEQMPAGSPQWAGRVQNLAQAYQGSGRHVQARAVVQDALARANALPEWNPAHIQLLNTLAEFWQQDGNLLRALSYREKAVAAFEATPPVLCPRLLSRCPPGSRRRSRALEGCPS